MWRLQEFGDAGKKHMLREVVGYKWSQPKRKAMQVATRKVIRMRTPLPNSLELTFYHPVPQKPDMVI